MNSKMINPKIQKYYSMSNQELEFAIAELQGFIKDIEKNPKKYSVKFINEVNEELNIVLSVYALGLVLDSFNDFPLTK